MNFTAYSKIFEYFTKEVSADLTMEDLEEYQLSVEDANKVITSLLRYPDNCVKVFKTVLSLNLNSKECKTIASSSSVRYEGEEYTDYKNRIKTRQEFERYSSKVLTLLGREDS